MGEIDLKLNVSMKNTKRWSLKIMFSKQNFQSGDVGLLGPGVHYLPVYWACGPSQEQGFVWGGEVFVRRDCVDE